MVLAEERQTRALAPPHAQKALLLLFLFSHFHFQETLCFIYTYLFIYLKQTVDVTTAIKPIDYHHIII